MKWGSSLPGWDASAAVIIGLWYSKVRMAVTKLKMPLVLDPTK